MNQQYEKLHKLTESLEFKLRDKIDDKSNPLSSRLQSEFRRFVDNVESEKSPRTLEDQAKDIKNLLRSCAEEGDKVMDYSDIDFFEDAFEDIRIDLRKFDNY
jgi:DNA/RNA-binding domain of Phe-tRNA-synthetase-like protein